ncbi:alpha/beta fold hydrolase [Streptomyces sp. NPDC058335]|uniref:alpha/beta fold hydrolase n=1 Tax=Streptomyces sp. NPDC058335 TaxID=3346451 RepID=UPI00366027D3
MGNQAPDNVIPRDRTLTEASLYRPTATVASAAQVYYEEISANTWSEVAADHGDGPGAVHDTKWSGGQDDWASGQRATVPTAVLLSTQDVTVRRWAERDHNIVRWTELDRGGGHFIAREAPGLLVSDTTRPPTPRRCP